MFELKCPNCGAPLIVPFRCEYCGSRFEQQYERIDLDFDKLPIVSGALYANDAVVALSCANPALCVKMPDLPTRTIR